MPRNPNLVPTVITDVNGRTTTVHKKRGDTTTAAKLPAPTAVDLAASIVTLMRKIRPLVDRDNHDLRNELQARYYPEAMQRIEAALRHGGPLGEGVAVHLFNGTHGWIVTESLHYYPKLGIEEFNRVARLVFSLSSYDGAQKSPSDSEEQGYVNLMLLTHLIDTMSTIASDDPSHPLEYNNENDNWSVAKIRNAALVDYIITTPDDMNELAEIIIKYGVTDPNTIMGIREGIAPALAEGTL